MDSSGQHLVLLTHHTLNHTHSHYSLFHNRVSETVAEGVILISNDIRALVRVVFREGSRRAQDALGVHMMEQRSEFTVVVVVVLVYEQGDTV